MPGILVPGKISFHADLNSKSNTCTKISPITFLCDCNGKLSW